jgi:hypothetical protein
MGDAAAGPPAASRLASAILLGVTFRQSRSPLRNVGDPPGLHRFGGWAMTGMGHEDLFPPRRLNDRCAFS